MKWKTHRLDMAFRLAVRMRGVHSADRAWERRTFQAERKVCAQILKGKVVGTCSEQFIACCAFNTEEGDVEEMWTKDAKLWEN